LATLIVIYTNTIGITKIDATILKNIHNQSLTPENTLHSLLRVLSEGHCCFIHLSVLVSLLLITPKYIMTTINTDRKESIEHTLRYWDFYWIFPDGYYRNCMVGSIFL